MKLDALDHPKTKSDDFYNRYGYFRYSKFPDEDLMDLGLHPVLPPDQRAPRLEQDEWTPLKNEVHKASNYICAYCGADCSDYAICDHLIPIARGGTNDIANLATSCDPCNLSKGMLTPEEFETKRLRT